MITSFRFIKTNSGFVGLVATERGLRRVYLPTASDVQLRRTIRRDFATAVEDANLLPELADEIHRYFLGEQVEFHARFDWTGWSSFEVDAWRACANIGYGETGTYGSLAERLGRPGAARAVGTAMGHNPFPIVIPCHRVLRSDGSLGGYSGPLGIDFKRRLLDLEAAAHSVHA